MGVTPTDGTVDDPSPTPLTPTPLTPTLLILAAGLGRRFGSLKQIDPVGVAGTALMDYTIADACAAGFGRVLVIAREEVAAEIRAHLDRTVGDRIVVDWVMQRLDDVPDGSQAPADRVRPWGTGHAVWCAREGIDGPFAVVNADDYYGPANIEALAAHLRSGSSEWAMVGFPLGDTLSEHGTVSRALCRVDVDGVLRGVEEAREIRSDDPRIDQVASMNLWGFTPSVFHSLEAGLRTFFGGRNVEDAEFAIADGIEREIASGSTVVRVIPSRDRWFGMTYRSERDAVSDRLAERGEPWR